MSKNIGKNIQQPQEENTMEVLQKMVEENFNERIPASDVRLPEFFSRMS
jgi:hypothetical protein